jgi:FtsP/CotA-like multicopper oxidase with cupredoxin domain
MMMPWSNSLGTKAALWLVSGIAGSLLFWLVQLWTGGPTIRTSWGSRSRMPAGIPRAFETVRVFVRFRDFFGRYPLHCHNIVHEDHGMMARWDVVPA